MSSMMILTKSDARSMSYSSFFSVLNYVDPHKERLRTNEQRLNILNQFLQSHSIPRVVKANKIVYKIAGLHTVDTLLDWIKDTYSKTVFGRTSPKRDALEYFFDRGFEAIDRTTLIEMRSAFESRDVIARMDAARLNASATVSDARYQRTQSPISPIPTEQTKLLQERQESRWQKELEELHE